MPGLTTIKKESPNVISVIELKKLLIELKEKRPDICIRFRLLGEMWARNFMRVILVTAKGVLLNDEVTNEAISIANLTNIMQFEIDNRFQSFHPHFHYEVMPSPEFE